MRSAGGPTGPRSSSPSQRRRREDGDHPALGRRRPVRAVRRRHVVARVDRFEAASGETVVIRPDVDEIANLTTTIWACQLTELFDLITTAARADLTNESLQRAIDELGEVSVTGVNGSLEERKYDVRDDPPILLGWDPAAGEFLPV